MVEFETESVMFPVILYDGEREINVGNISINPTLEFKQFQKKLKQTVGISYNNLTTYFVDRVVSKTIPSERRRILITSKVDFSVIVRETNFYFLVVLKRSRRDRRKKVNKPSAFPSLVVSPEYMLHLSRVDGHEHVGYGPYVYDDLFSGFRMNWNGVMYSPVDVNAYVDCETERALCEECLRAEREGRKGEFHFCVYDDVVSGGLGHG
ncbi:hypothetical protein QVD17_37537 [Tagetes erecta]|uniref:DUF7138 domain-containing protein n=1 Tax=Tagetes erecta TaxID=13708 RepID=A0AAD8JUE5_TARER|nr:hypothetical protein QVD17_37537 [Tagetes erecta]